jgi:phosphatidylglycerol---prolipoprotein diacylglyceryl transferase
MKREGLVLAFIQFDPVPWIELGPLRVSPHGIGTAVGFLAGACLLLPATRARGVDDDLVYTMLWRALLGALLGARLAYVVNHPGEFHNVGEVLAVWEGGLSLLGGIAGGVAAAYPTMRAHRLPFWSLMDAAAPGLALGIAIGRVGDIVVGDHLGKPTDFALGFRCTAAETASPCVAPHGDGVHMPALYDMVSVTALLVVLLALRRIKRWDGFLFLVFVAWYGAGRVIEDFFRVDETHGTGLSASQWTALVASLASLYILVIHHRTPRLRRSAESNDPPARPEEPAPAGPSDGRRAPSGD